jgi:hypothetical protein
LLAVLLAARGRWLMAGLAAGGAVLMKQPSGTVLVPLVLLALGQARPHQGWRPVGLALAGFVGVLVVVAGVLAVQGALGAAIEYVLMINLERIRTPASLGGFGGDDTLHVIWQAFRDGLAPLWLLGALGVLAAARLPARWRPVLLGWVLVDALLLLRLREVLQLAPSVALLGGWAAGSLWRAAGQAPYLGLARAAFARLALLGVLGSVVLLSSGYQQSIVMRALNERSVHGLVRSPDEFVADALAKVPPGPLYVWGEGTELYLLSQRPPAASTLNAIPLSANLPGSAARRAQLVTELQATTPVAIVVSPEAERAGTGLAVQDFSAFAALLQAAYVPLDEVSRDPKYGGWRIYVRRAAA